MATADPFFLPPDSAFNHRCSPIFRQSHYWKSFFEQLGTCIHRTSYRIRNVNSRVNEWPTRISCPTFAQLGDLFINSEWNPVDKERRFLRIWNSIVSREEGAEWIRFDICRWQTRRNRIDNDRAKLPTASPSSVSPEWQLPIENQSTQQQPLSGRPYWRISYSLSCRGEFFCWRRTRTRLWLVSRPLFRLFVFIGELVTVGNVPSWFSPATRIDVDVIGILLRSAIWSCDVVLMQKERWGTAVSFFFFAFVIFWEGRISTVHLHAITIPLSIFRSAVELASTDPMLTTKKPPLNGLWRVRWWFLRMAIKPLWRMG